MKKLLTLLAVVAFSAGAYAQKITVESGKASALKSIKKWDVVFDYDGMEFDKKGNEQDWLNSTQKEKNEKEPGSGDAFVDDWNGAKAELFPMSFSDGFNKALSKKMGVTSKPGSGTPTIHVKTTWAFSGFKAPVAFKAAKVTTTITFKDEEGNTLAVFKVDKAQGVPPGATSSYSSVGYKVSERMSASYQMTGLALGKYLKKAAYK